MLTTNNLQLKLYKKVIFKLFLFYTISCVSQNNLKSPKLVIGIVVDQMRTEYLYRFQNDFSLNGFNRLIQNGYMFHNMHYNYVPTYTGPGHASIFTGATPSVHGIVGNEWFHKNLKKDIYCTDDNTVSALGNSSNTEGEMSPKLLQSTTITDELKLATNFKGKVIGLSLKDRGAILPAGHFANWAFWYSKTGSFISSTFYGKELPKWVSTFNNKKHYETYLNKGWNLLKPIQTYNESLPDNNPYEMKLNKKEPFFPYNLKEMLASNDPGIIRTSPFGNNLLVDLAKEAITNENLGADFITDFLSVSFSSPDYIGHTFGPRSIEIQDTYLRLDELIADFLNFLDEKVGKDNYLVFLTADHAAAENVTQLKDNKFNVVNIKPKEIKQLISEFSIKNYGDDFCLEYSNFNFFLDKDKLKAKNLDYNKVLIDFKEFFMQQSFVRNVYTPNEIAFSSYTDIFLQMISRGYDPFQNGDLIILDKPGFIQYYNTGTSHGTPYNYDTHVPCIFYGWNIKKGECFEKKVITQIAPTLSQKLKITFPNASNTEVLTELLK